MQKTRGSSAEAPTAIVYCRVSTGHQRDAKTIKEQIETCNRLVKQHGLRLVKYGPKRDGILLDDGVSGSLLQGRAFKAFIDDARGGFRPNFVVVYSLSRIAREDKSSRMERQEQSAEDNGRIKAVLRGDAARPVIKVIDEDGENDPNTVLFDLKLTLASEEYKLIKHRTLGGRRRRLAEGKYARGGRPPFGYALVHANGKDNTEGWSPVVHTEAARIVKRVLGWYVKGGHSFAAEQANDERLPTPPAKCLRGADAPLTGGRGAEWTKSTVSHVVDDVGVYLTGEQDIMQDGKPYRIKYPPIIGDELHAGVERRKKEHAPRKKTKFLSAGFCTCAKCGGRVWVKNGIGRIDAPSYRYIRCDCGSMSAPRFQSALWVMVATRYLQIAAHEKGNGEKNGAAYEADLRDARAKVQAVQAKLDTLARALANGMDEDTWKNTNGPLVDEKTAAQREVARIERERDEAAQQKATVETTEARVAKVLERLRIDGAPDVDGCRKLLADVLVGGRVTVEWGGPSGRGRGCSPWAALTLPTFGKLPAFTGRTDQIPEAVLGAAVQRGSGVHVMVQSRGDHVGGGAVVHAYSTVPLAGVLEGKGAKIGVRLHVAGEGTNRAALVLGSGELPLAAVVPKRPRAPTSRSSTTRK